MLSDIINILCVIVQSPVVLLQQSNILLAFKLNLDRLIVGLICLSGT